MTSFLGADTAWALVVIVVIPIVVVAAAELDERIRQRRSPLRAAVQILRNWTVPAVAAWAILAGVLGLDADNFLVRAAASVVVLGLGASILSAMRVTVAGLRERRRAADRQAPPQLLLALPRLLTVLVVGWVLLSRVWGVDLSGLLAALGVTSLVVSFALQDTLSGLASGMLLLSDRPFGTGDWIRAGDLEGVVVDINWRTSRIRDRNGDMHVVPNSELAGSSVLNYSSPDVLHRVVVSLQVAYVNPPTLAKEMLLDAARGTPGVLADPAPNVRVVQIDDPLMGYEVDLWVDDYAIAPRVKSDFGSLVWYQSHRHDVPLPSPAQDLYLYDGPSAGLAGEPTLSDIRKSLQDTPLLAVLSEADLDRFARAGRPARYSVGETMIDSRRPSQDLLVIVEGSADLVLSDVDGRETLISEVSAPDTIGLLEAPASGGAVLLRAVSDCEVITIEASVASEVGSRDIDLAAALNRTAELRRRRIDRLLDQKALGQ